MEYTAHRKIYILIVDMEMNNMLNMNEVISSNIMKHLKKRKRQIDLANYMGISKQIVSNMLSGTRTINAVELKELAFFFKIPMEELVKIPEKVNEVNVVRAFMGKVDSESAKKGLEIADQLANLICFYAKANDTAEKMMQPWEA